MFNFVFYLQTDVCSCTKHVDLLQTEMSSQLMLLRKTLQSKAAVATATVFVSPLIRVSSQIFLRYLDLGLSFIFLYSPDRFIFFQPLFKAVSKKWTELQEEAALLNILSKITLSLKPFISSQSQMFSETYLNDLLEASEVKTDEQRMAETSGTSEINQTTNPSKGDPWAMTQDR